MSNGKPMADQLIPVIMSGGSGTRLWPLSRQKYPKQFCRLTGESLLGSTVRRLGVFGAPFVLTTRDLVSGSQQALRQCGFSEANIIAEPFGRNTAAAVALTCSLFQKKGWGQKIAGIFPADHLVLQTENFARALNVAIAAAKEGSVVTLGICPRSPATGYGYIELDGAMPSDLSAPEASPEARPAAMPVRGFREKPDRATAEGFLASRSFVWNAGIFVFRVDRMVEHFQRLMPELWSAISSLREDLSNLESVYGSLKSISIDYGIMEHLKEQACVPCEIGWSDLGSWDDVAELLGHEGSGLPNQARTFAHQSQNCFVMSTEEKVVGLIGVDDLMVVDTKDALLIARKGHGQEVREIVEALKTAKHASILEHGFEERPWGKFEILRNEATFKSKKITVNPGARISYQSHDKRAEHWIIVRGRGEVVLNEEVIPVSKGSAVFIPLRAKHRISNTSDEPLEFIEVQTGEYFGEDDIVRYSDDYKRV